MFRRNTRGPGDAGKYHINVIRYFDLIDKTGYRMGETRKRKG